MGYVLRTFLPLTAVCAVASAQSLTEAAAAAAGGAAGGAAGKKVSEGITAIFEKVDKQTAAAANNTKDTAKSKEGKGASKAALIEAGPGKPESDDFAPPSAPKATKAKPNPKSVAAVVDPSTDFAPVPARTWADVPPPPPLPRRGSAVAAKPAPPQPVAATPPPPPPPPPLQPPPPPPVTAEDLQKITEGTSRDDVVKLGPPTSRITMFENGGLLEIFTYHPGTIRVSDGAVSSVQVH